MPDFEFILAADASGRPEWQINGKPSLPRHIVVRQNQVIRFRGSTGRIFLVFDTVTPFDPNKSISLGSRPPFRYEQQGDSLDLTVVAATDSGLYSFSKCGVDTRNLDGDDINTGPG